MILLSRAVRVLIFVFLLIFIGNASVLAQCNFSKGPLGEICNNATYICGSELNGYVGKFRIENSTTIIWPNENDPTSGVCGNNGSFDNTSWFSFTACSSLVHLRIYFTNCVTKPGNDRNPFGVQAGLYDKCNKKSSVACQNLVNMCPDQIIPCKTLINNASNFIDLSYNNFRPGQLVYFVLDGYSGTVCEFRVEVISGLDITPVTPPDKSKLTKGYVNGPTQLRCTDSNIPFSYNLTEPERAVNFSNSCIPPSDFNPKDSICYEWNVSPSAGSYFKDNKNTGTKTDIIFTQPGTYTISAVTNFNPFYVGSCANAAAGDITSWTVTVAEPDTTILPTISICPGNTFSYLGISVSKDTTILDISNPCKVKSQSFKVERNKENILGIQSVCIGQSFRFQGKEYYKGSFEVVDASDCALVHKFEVIEKPVTQISAGTKYVCQGQMYAFQGKNYGTGDHVVKDSSRCDLEHTFKVENVNIALGVRVDTTVLTCSVSSINAIALINTNVPDPVSIVWKSTSNNTISQTSQTNISQPGTYIVTASYLANGNNCTNTTQFSITSDIAPPKITAAIPSLKCITNLEKYPDIVVASSTPLKSSEWVNPLGQRSQGARVLADSSNVITGKPFLFKATGLNGCVTDTSFVIPYNFEKANAQLKGDVLNCYRTKDTIQLSTNINVDSVRWYRVSPDLAFYGSYPAKLFLEVDAPGIYKAEVMASSSKCWSEKQITINEDKVKPEMNLTNNLLWHCNTSNLEIEPSVITNGNYQFAWSTLDGKIGSAANEKKLRATAIGTYTITILDKSNGCQKSGDLKIIEDPEKPRDIVLDVVDISCFGQNNGQAIIKSVSGGYGPYSYTINQQSATLQNLNLKKGDYVIEVKDKYDCSYNKTFRISEPQLLELQTEDEVTIAFNEKARLTFESNFPDSEISSIVWKNSKGEVLSNEFEFDFSTIQDEIISLEVTTMKGCIAKTTIRINVENELNLIIPNIFSPNNDGINDRLIMFKNRIPFTLNQYAIFDRYGNRVYQTTNDHFNQENEGWDGTFNNEPVESGVYILVIDYVDFLGTRKIIRKDITVVR